MRISPLELSTTVDQLHKLLIMHALKNSLSHFNSFQWKGMLKIDYTTGAETLFLGRKKNRMKSGMERKPR